MKALKGELSLEALAAVSAALGREYASGTTGVAGYDRKGNLAAVVVLGEVFAGNRTIEVVRLKRLWATREFVREVFEEAFADPTVIRISCQIPAYNVPSMRLAHALGFELEAILRDFAFGDLLMLKLLRKKWGE